MHCLKRQRTRNKKLLKKVTVSSSASRHFIMAHCWSPQEASTSQPWEKRFTEPVRRDGGREMLGLYMEVRWGVLKVHDSQLNVAGGYQICRCLHQLDATRSSRIPQTPPAWCQETASVLHTNKLKTKPAGLYGIPQRKWEGWASKCERVKKKPRGKERQRERQKVGLDQNTVQCFEQMSKIWLILQPCALFDTEISATFVLSLLWL